MALTNAQYDAIMRVYNDRRLRDQKQRDRRRTEVGRKIPRIREISREIASLSVRKASSLLGEGSAEDFDLSRAIRNLAEERKALLLAHGYPADYLDMHYECGFCHDTGYVNGKKCVCFRRAELDYLYSGSNGTKLPEEEDFAHFSLKYYDETIVDPVTGLSSRAAAALAEQSAVRFVERFGSEFENIVFYGDTGVGKSFLSHCIASALVQKGYSVLYLTAFDLFDILAKEAFSKDNDQEEHSEHIMESDLLIIDDLGTELTNAFSSSRLFLCVNERILKQKPTVISTNLSLEKIAEIYSERTFSRMMSHYQLIHLFGKDIRIQKQLSGGV